MKPWIIVLIVLAVIAVILGLLYYFGKKAQTKQAAQQEQMEAMKQTVSMLIIDKKKLRMKDSGLPQMVIDQTPKMMRRAKLPIVKAKVGPRIMTLICDAAILDPGKKRSQGYRKRYLYHRSSRHPRFFRAAGKEKRLLAENAPQGTRRGEIKFHLKQKETRFACFFLLSRQSPRSRASPDFGSLLAKIPELNDFHSSRVFFYKFSFPPSRGLTSISITQSPT